MEKLKRDYDFDVKMPADLLGETDPGRMYKEYILLWEYAEFLKNRLAHAETMRFKEGGTVDGIAQNRI